MTEERIYPDAHRFTPSRPDGVVCIVQRTGANEPCGYPYAHPIHVNTPAERITGISDRRAAALVDVITLRVWFDDDAGAQECLDRIEAALREGEAR